MKYMGDIIVIFLYMVFSIIFSHIVFLIYKFFQILGIFGAVGFHSCIDINSLIFQGT